MIVEKRENGRVETEATIKIWVDGERYVRTAEGNGPVNALDKRAARRDRRDLPAPRRHRADQLQGAHPRRVEGHRRGHARAARRGRRRRVVGLDRRLRERDRGVAGRRSSTRSRPACCPAAPSTCARSPASARPSSDPARAPGPGRARGAARAGDAALRAAVARAAAGRVRGGVRAPAGRRATPPRCRAAPPACTWRSAPPASRRGDEVITSPFSFVASANVMLYEGARPVFVDIDPVTLNISPEAAAAAVTERTSGLLPVHIFGYPADTPGFERLAADRGLWLVEDTCEALGAVHADGTLAGARGNLAVFAFYANKQLTTGEGGMVVCPDADGEGADRLRAQPGPRARHGLARPRPARLQLPAVRPGLRARASRSSSGSTQMLRRPRARRRRCTRDALGGPRRASSCRRRRARTARAARGSSTSSSCPHGVDRDATIEALRARGVDSKPYLPAIHLMSFYRERFGHREGEFPNAEDAARRCLALPFFPELTEGEVAQVAERSARGPERRGRLARERNNKRSNTLDRSRPTRATSFRRGSQPAAKGSTMSLPEVVYAQASPRSIGGTSLVRGRRGDRRRRRRGTSTRRTPSSRTRRTRCASAGFDVLQIAPTTINIAGPAAAVRGDLQDEPRDRGAPVIKARRSARTPPRSSSAPTPSCAGLIDTERHPSLAGLIEGVAIEEPVYWMQNAFPPPQGVLAPATCRATCRSALNADRAHRGFRSPGAASSS